MAGGRVMRTVLGLSHACGAPRVWDLLRGGRTKVLMYHGVPRRSDFAGIENLYGYQVPVAEFEAQLTYLARHTNVISLADFLAGRRLARSRTNVVLTFDDGYENNATEALPVLERLGLPAVFAVTSGFALAQRPLYNDVIEYVVQRCALDRVELDLTDGRRAFDLTAPGGRRELYDWVMYECVRMPQGGRDAFVQQVQELLGVVAEPAAMFASSDYRPMSAEQVRRVAEHELIEVASHSVNHYLLSRADLDTKRYELNESRRQLEEATGRPCRTFCVPGGAWDGEMVEEATAAGYECVLTSDVGLARRGSRVLNRFGVFRQPALVWFADQVRGPVHELAGAARRARRKLRAAR